jgi:hypothetical protein
MPCAFIIWIISSMMSIIMLELDYAKAKATDDPTSFLVSPHYHWITFGYIIML